MICIGFVHWENSLCLPDFEHVNNQVYCENIILVILACTIFLGFTRAFCSTNLTKLHIFAAEQKLNTQSKKYFPPMTVLLCIDLELTPSEIYDVA